MTTVFSASRLRLSIEAALYKVETERDGHALQKAKGNVFSFSQESLDEAKLHQYCQLTPRAPRRNSSSRYLLFRSDFDVPGFFSHARAPITQCQK